MTSIGCLKAVELNLDAFMDQGHSPTRGTDAWLLAVTVTDPTGLVAQVGGLQYHAAKNHFYLRRYVQYVQCYLPALQWLHCVCGCTHLNRIHVSWLCH